MANPSPTTTKLSSSAGTRNEALDFTRGGLVLLMVLYHWLNYFVPSEVEVYRYLRFLTPGFIFITGFVVASVYFSRRDGSSPAARLATRGIKLLGLFAGLNLAIGLLISRSHTSLWSPEGLVNVFVSGNTNVGGIKAAAFYVLIPISYLLLVSALLVVVHNRWAYIVEATVIGLISSRLVLAWAGLICPNVDMLAIGSLGILVGRLPSEKIERIVDYPLLLGIAYVFQATALAIWNVIYVLQVTSVFVNLAVLYAFGMSRGLPERLKDHFKMLGRYSLFGYIAQICILQVLRRGFQGVDESAPMLLVSFLAAFALTSITVVAVDRARARAALVNRMYSVVFS
jgi:hypothetical protein